jgi:FkbM family methyltransferase
MIPNDIYVHYYNLSRLLLPNLKKKIIREDGHWIVTSSSSEKVTHTSSPKKTVILEKSQVLDKYMCEGFIEVEDGDIVFDVGAFIGEFSYNIVNKADQVIAIEPEDENMICFRENVGAHNSESVTVIQGVAWRENTTLELNISPDPTEHSISAPDFGLKSEKMRVDARTIDDIASELNISKIDFLKIEAEGAEMDVLDGVDETHVNKMAIDVSESNAEFSSSEISSNIIEELNKRGYETRKINSIVFGKMDD